MNDPLYQNVFKNNAEWAAQKKSLIQIFFPSSDTTNP